MTRGHGFFGILILVIVIFFRVNIYSSTPSIYAQEQIFRSEEKNLKIVELVEKRREFVRNQTYLVYYEFQNGNNITEHQKKIEEIISTKFMLAGWMKKNERITTENRKIINFIKQNKEYYCEVEVYKTGVALRFRYK
ncbi:MAG: hypothetical protein Q4E64_04270 [Phascolarctobacterium sp.]|uniref:hypothetical protein n=1 Tax=Phascolarctobacterium sp. TaxID=2049039 RepID=UPI0026DC21BE|nr:hypothetical protein [Phascolarctobacterium sp.]MDO4921028.1 hypothetical protein [Phascolarctobacterium sp.]